MTYREPAPPPPPCKHVWAPDWRRLAILGSAATSAQKCELCGEERCEPLLDFRESRDKFKRLVKDMRERIRKMRLRL